MARLNSSPTQGERAMRFHQLHMSGPLVLANLWMGRALAW
jgi:hypothetical protein